MLDPASNVQEATAPSPAAAPEGRREERYDASWLVIVVLPDGREIRSSAKDVSMSGARLAIPADVSLPPSFMFKVVGKDFVVQARLAWRRGNYVGVTIEKTAKLPTKSDAPAPRRPDDARKVSLPESRRAVAVTALSLRH